MMRQLKRGAKLLPNVEKILHCRKQKQTQNCADYNPKEARSNWKLASSQHLHPGWVIQVGEIDGCSWRNAIARGAVGVLFGALPLALFVHRRPFRVHVLQGRAIDSV